MSRPVASLARCLGAPEATPANRPIILELDRVTCEFPSNRGSGSYCAVRDASLDLQEGEFVSIVGPTGCGKSTLLNVAAGLLGASAGEVRLEGALLAGLNRHAAYMFQSDALLPWLTAQANVALGLELRGVKRAEARARADQWLARVGLAGRSGAYPHQLSGGMAKRVALAQVLILEPRILLMDEPFSALDVQTRQRMENQLLELCAQLKMSVMFVTHDLEEAIALGDRVIVMSAGPGTSPIAEFHVDIARPRDVSEIVQHPHYAEIHRAIWENLKTEVARTYDREVS